MRNNPRLPNDSLSRALANIIGNDALSHRVGSKRLLCPLFNDRLKTQIVVFIYKKLKPPFNRVSTTVRLDR